MPYLGRDLDKGNYLKLDDISSSFNGSTTTFDLKAGGSDFYPGSAYAILVSLGGILQEPEGAYTINNNQITFASAPVSGDTFFCTVIGTSVGIGVPGHGTVNGSQLASPFNYDAGLLYLDSTNDKVGIASESPTVELDVKGRIKGDYLTAVAATFTGNVSIAGTLSYQDVEYVDSVGIITAQTGIHLEDYVFHKGDLNTKLGFPAVDTFTVETAGTERFRINETGITTITGQTTIATTGYPQLILKDSDSNSPNDTNGISLRSANNTEYGFIGQTESGGHSLFIKTVATTNPIRLQVNSTTRFEVGNSGCYVTGVFDVASGGTSSLRGDVYIPDKLRHIGDDDTSIRFPAPDTFAVETGGNERIRSTSSQTRIGSQAATDKTSYDIQLSGAVNNDAVLSLYNPTSNQFEGIRQGFFFNNSNGTVAEFARITSTAIDTTAATVKGDLRFHTLDASSGHLTEKLRINSIGNVSLGAETNNSDIHSSYRCLQVYKSAYIWGYSSGSYPAVHITNNARPTTSSFTSGWKRDLAGTYTAPVQLELYTGNFNVRTADNDTANSDISWATRFTVKQDGKVGINESTPDGNQLIIRAASTVGTKNGHIMLTGDSATNGEGPQIVFSESGSGSNYAGAYVGHIREGSNSTGSLVFGTRSTSGDANTVPTEKLRIWAAGTVEANTSISDTYAATTNITPHIRVRNKAGADNIYGGIELRADRGNGAAAMFNIACLNNASNYQSTLVFQSRKGDGNFDERLRINSDGNVKIADAINETSQGIFYSREWCPASTTTLTETYQNTIEFGNEVGTWIITATFRSNTNRHTSYCGILNVGAYDKNLTQLGTTTNHYSTGQLEVRMRNSSDNGTDGETSYVQVKCSTAPGVGSIRVRALRLSNLLG